MNNIYLKKITNDYPIGKAVSSIIRDLGSIKKIFPEQEKILIKPNFFLGRSSESGTTTNIALIKAVINEVKKAKKEPILIESGGMGYDFSNNPLVVGMKRLFRLEGIKFLDPLRIEKTKIKIPNSLVLKEIEIPKVVKEYGMINLPKIKTHEGTTVSLAIKNLIGLIPQKYRYIIHAKGLDKGLVDLYNLVNPKLNIADGTVIMEGNGPALGQSKVRTNIIIGSKDAALLDYSICRLLFINPEKVKHISLAIRGIKDFPVKQFSPLAKIKLPSRKKIYHQLMRLLMAINKDIWFPLFKTDFLPIRDRIFRQKPVVKDCLSCKNCPAFCPFDNFDKEDKKIKNYYLCKACHWCSLAETCPENKIKARKILYLKGFLEFLGSYFKKVPKIKKGCPEGVEFCPAEAVRLRNSSSVKINKEKCLKCPICFTDIICKSKK